MENQNNLVQEISLELIDQNPDQSRQEYDESMLNELADSIDKVGLINPISVLKVGERYKLLAGSRRLRAHQLLRKIFIRATIHKEGDTQELSVMAHENLYRADLSPVEEANFYARLIAEQNMSIAQLIHLTGKAESYVLARIRLLQCSQKLLDYVHNGKLHISAALELAKLPTPEMIEQYTEYAISSGANLQTIRYWRQQVEANASIPSSGDAPPTPLVQTGQPTVFGWNCYSCDNFHPAQDCITIHVCPHCFADLETAKKSK